MKDPHLERVRAPGTSRGGGILACGAGDRMARVARRADRSRFEDGDSRRRSDFKGDFARLTVTRVCRNSILFGDASFSRFWRVGQLGDVEHAGRGRAPLRGTARPPMHDQARRRRFLAERLARETSPIAFDAASSSRANTIRAPPSARRVDMLHLRPTEKLLNAEGIL
jgi:hypothetical protein